MKHLDITFDSFPFDTDITVPGDAQYILCYDVTDSINKQIRQKNII